MKYLNEKATSLYNALSHSTTSISSTASSLYNKGLELKDSSVEYLKDLNIGGKLSSAAIFATDAAVYAKDKAVDFAMEAKLRTDNSQIIPAAKTLIINSAYNLKNFYEKVELSAFLSPSSSITQEHDINDITITLDMDDNLISQPLTTHHDEL